MISALAPGTRVGSFVIESLVGTGNIARVYRAYEPSLHRRVALKVLAPALAADEDFVGRFRRDGTHAAQLQHPDIVSVYEVGRDGDAVFAAMRLVTGSTLRSMIARRGHLRPADALAILGRAAEALDHAHRRGFVHGDLRPSNVFLEQGGQVSLSDFGPSMAAATSVSAGGQSMATPVYTGPEQVAGGDVDVRSDLYSFAAVAFECLTGAPPFRAGDVVGSARSAPRAVPSAAERNPELPVGVDGVFERGLASEPADRYATATGFVDDLDGALGLRPRTGPSVRPSLAPAPTPAPTPAPIPAPARPRRRRSLPVVLGVAVLAALIAGAAFFSFASTDGGSGAATLDINRTPLIYRAPLNGSEAGFVDRTGRPPGNRTVIAVPGALVLTVGRNGQAGRDLVVPSGVVDYIMAVDFAITPGSRVTLDLGLRWSTGGAVGDLLRVDTIEGNATFARFERGTAGSGPRTLAVGDAVKVPGLTTGQVQHLAIVVRGNTLELYRDGVRLVATADPKIPTAPTAPGIDALGNLGTGTVRILGVQLHSVPPR
jgi:hypothetical protein